MQASPQCLDHQYNPLASVPDAPALFAVWEARSAQARGAFDCQLDLRYGLGPLETLDLFPAPGNKAPVLVFIHGGYWRGSDKRAYGFIAPSFVKKGASVVLLNYDLCPAVSIRTICGQVDSALDWVRRNLAAYGGDPAKIVLVGHSAGAHLAAMALLQRSPTSSKALCISGLFDLAPLRDAPFIRDDLKLSAQDAYDLSPIHAAPPASATVMTAVGALESEAFHQQTASLQASWGTELVPVMDCLPQRNHFDVLDALADEDGLLHARACSLLFA